MTLWLLKGKPSAPGWLTLEQDARSEAADVLLFDRDAWALMKAAQPPDGYEGLTPQTPPPGRYLDNFGRPCYIADGAEVQNARAVVKTLGDEAAALLEKLGDADLVLERLGRSY